MCAAPVDLFRAHAVVPTERGALPACSDACLSKARTDDCLRTGSLTQPLKSDDRERVDEHAGASGTAPSPTVATPSAHLVEILLQEPSLLAIAAVTGAVALLGLLGGLFAGPSVGWGEFLFLVLVIALRTWVWVDRMRVRHRSLRRISHDSFPETMLRASVRLQPIVVMSVAITLVAFVNGDFAFAKTLFVLACLLCGAPLLYFAESIPRAAAVVSSALMRRGIHYPSPATFYALGADTRVVITETFFSRAAPPRLLRVQAFGSCSRKHLLGLAAKVSENHPSHQLAQTSAIALAPSELVRLRRSTFVPGYGFDAMTSDGERVLVGTRRLLHENGISIAKANSDVTIAASQGHVMHFVAINDTLEGMLVLVDTPSPGSRAAVHRLMDAHASVTFVTGRMQPTTKTLGNALDLTDIRADLRTDEQAALVQEFARAGERVCVIGEPFDATALWEHANSAVVLGDARPVLPITQNQVGVDGTDPRIAAAAVWLPRQFLWYVRRSTMSTVVIALGALALAAVGPYWLAPPVLLALEFFTSEQCRRFTQRQLGGLPPVETDRVILQDV